MTDRPCWNPELETPDPEQLAPVEEQRLREQLAWVWERSPFYRQKLAAAGVDVAAVRLADLAGLPFTTKDEVRRTQEEAPPLGGHTCVPLSEVVRIHASSGTTGAPTLVGATARDRQMWVELMCRCLWAEGARPGQRAMVALSMGWWIAGVSFVDALQHLGVTLLPAGNVEPARTLAVVQRLGVDFVATTPSFAAYLADFAQNRLDLDPARLGVRHLALGGEPGAGIPEVRRQLQETWGCPVYDSMGTADFSTLVWSECEYRNGMHFLGQGFILPEILDPATLRPIALTPGATGELVCTAIWRQCVPLIRFRIGDLVRVEGTGRCGCGRTGLRIRCIGRVDDMLIVRGVNVYPSAVLDVVASLAPRTTGEMQIVLDRPGTRQEPPLRVVAEYGPAADDLDALKTSLEGEMRQRLIVQTVVELVPPGTLTPKGAMKRQLVVHAKTR